VSLHMSVNTISQIRKERPTVFQIQRYDQDALDL
jgi:hypothetical protein